MLKPPFKFPIYFVSFLLIVIFGFCWMIYNVNPLKIVKYLGAQVASGVGLSVKVPENPINTWAEELKKKELSLKEREELLAKKEAQSRVIYILILSLITILFFLIFFNFYLDFKSHQKYRKV